MSPTDDDLEDAGYVWIVADELGTLRAICSTMQSAAKIVQSYKGWKMDSFKLDTAK